MPASIAYTIQDAGGKSSTLNINIPTATTAANAITFAQSMATLLDAVTKGKITGVGVCYIVALPGGLKASADPMSDVEEGARLSFLTALNHRTSFRIPTFDETMLLSGTKSVDLEDAAVDAVVDAMTAGLAGTIPVDTRDEDIVSVATARENFQRDRG